ncbi:MAG: LacI family DNA-binding transcriptional regulator [Candidatus Omnitrophota bacterium]
MSITIKEIAKKSGYGVGTVSRALRSSPILVKKETREKILKVAQKYGYVKNMAAQTLVTGSSLDIGLAIPAIFDSPFYNDFYIKFISGIIDNVDSYGYNLRVLLLRNETAFADMMKEIRALRISALIMCPYIESFLMKTQDILKLSLPVVVVSEDIEGKGIYSVILDDFNGGYDGAMFLIESGHTHIGVIRGYRWDIEERFNGFKQAIKDNGIALNYDFILRGDAKARTGFSCMKKMLKKKKKPTAVFCLDDEMACGAMRAIRDEGLKCPEDVSVLGFDGIDIGRFTEPQLTTMVRPVALMGKKAVEILLSGDRKKQERVVKVKAELIERESCRRLSK